MEGFEVDRTRAANAVSEHVRAWFKSLPARFCVASEVSMPLNGNEAFYALRSKPLVMIEFPSLPPLPDGQFKTLMVDPPWAYDDEMPGPGRGSKSHYDTLHYGTVLGMAPQIRKVTAPSAHLYLWTTNSFMEEALRIAAAWGFDQKTIITWVKVTEEPPELPHERDRPIKIEERIGMGHYLRNVTEHILFCTKGNLSTSEDTVPNVFFAERGGHSTKPEKAYELAEVLSPAPRLDLFARSKRKGWETWGDETQEDASLDDF